MKGEWEILLGVDFFSAGEHMSRSAFLCKKLKKVIYVKMKMVQKQWLQLKMKFYWFIT